MKFFNWRKKKKNTRLTLEALSIWKALNPLHFFSGLVSVNSFNTFINVYWLSVSQFACFSMAPSSKIIALPGRQTTFFYHVVSIRIEYMGKHGKMEANSCCCFIRLVLSKYRFSRGTDFKLCKKIMPTFSPILSSDCFLFLVQCWW